MTKHRVKDRADVWLITGTPSHCGIEMQRRRIDNGMMLWRCRKCGAKVETPYQPPLEAGQ